MSYIVTRESRDGFDRLIGGAMLALLDKEGLSNASTLDTELETLDGLMGQLGTSEDIFSNVSERLVFHRICYYPCNAATRDPNLWQLSSFYSSSLSLLIAAQ